MAQETQIIYSPDDIPCKTTTLKVGDINVNIKNNFYPKKSLYDILLSIANTRLKEKSA